MTDQTRTPDLPSRLRIDAVTAEAFAQSDRASGNYATATRLDEIAQSLRDAASALEAQEVRKMEYTDSPEGQNALLQAEEDARVEAQAEGAERPTASAPSMTKVTSRHGGNIGRTPFYLYPWQCEPEYDQGHSVIVWYDDLVLKQEDLAKAEAHLAAHDAEIATREAEWHAALDELVGITLEPPHYTVSGIRTLKARIDEHDAVIATLRAGWQPIETAPKDGTWLLLQGFGWTLPEVGGWTTYGDGYWRTMEEAVEPTYWQPLPAPPGQPDTPREAQDQDDASTAMCRCGHSKWGHWPGHPDRTHCSTDCGCEVYRPKARETRTVTQED